LNLIDDSTKSEDASEFVTEIIRNSQKIIRKNHQKFYRIIRNSTGLNFEVKKRLTSDWTLYLSGKIEQFNLTKVKSNSEKLNWLEMEREHIW